MPVNPPTLPPVRPSKGAEAKYREQLQKLVDAMARAVLKKLRTMYRANVPVIAQDEMPSTELRKAIKKMSKRWQKQFDDGAPQLAEYFTKAANKRSKLQLQKILKDAGFTVEFKMTRAVRDVMNASIGEQVSLIKSIPEKFFTDVEGAVMRSVAKGGSLGDLTAHLEKQYGLTHRRAAFIARDQNNKATAVITRTRQLEAGVTEAIWVHSGGGKTQRKSHVAASKRGQKYDVRKGWFDPDVQQFIQPGELPNCRCVSRPVIPGF